MKANALSLKYHKYMRGRLITSRVMMLILSAFTLVLVAMTYFGPNFIKGMNVMWNCVSICYLCGMLFTMNAWHQDLCRAKKWARASRVFAFILYLAVVALLVIIILESTGVLFF